MHNTSSASSTESPSVEVYQTPTKSNAPANTQEDSPISIMSDSSRRALNDDFEASAPRPFLITGASNWADDSDDEDFL